MLRFQPGQAYCQSSTLCFSDSVPKLLLLTKKAGDTLFRALTPAGLFSSAMCSLPNFSHMEATFSE